jgi:hypothetical protein
MLTAGQASATPLPAGSTQPIPSLLDNPQPLPAGSPAVPFKGGPPTGNLAGREGDPPGPFTAQSREGEPPDTFIEPGAD